MIDRLICTNTPQIWLRARTRQIEIGNLVICYLTHNGQNPQFMIYIYLKQKYISSINKSIHPYYFSNNSLVYCYNNNEILILKYDTFKNSSKLVAIHLITFQKNALCFIIYAPSFFKNFLLCHILQYELH